MSSHRPRASVAVLVAAVAVAAACGPADEDGGAPDAVRDRGAPDVLPAIRSAELPFQYPPELYERRVQANVLLRLFVDSVGRVVPESTRVAEQSGYPALDSAALSGARELEFEPARHDGVPVGVTVLLPVHFRHPAADTTASGDTAGRGTQ